MSFFIALGARIVSAPVLSASLNGTTAAITLVTPAQEPISGIAYYILSRSVNNGPYNAIAPQLSPAGFPYIDSNLSLGTTYSYYAQAVDNSTQHDISPLSNTVSVTTQAAPPPPPSGTIIFTPGHWVSLSGGGLSAWKARMSSVKSQGFVGLYVYRPLFSWIAGSGANPATGTRDYSQLTNALDTLLPLCPVYGIQLGIGWEDRAFGQQPNPIVTTPSAAGLPAYWDTNNYVYYPRPYSPGPPPSTNPPKDPGGFGGETTGLARNDLPYTTNEVILFAQALAKYLSTSQYAKYFEMFRGPESAIQSGTGISNGNYSAQIQQLYPQLRSILPNLDISHSMNYFGTSQQISDCFTVFKSTGLCGSLGPDQDPGRTYTSNQVFNGTLNGVDYRNVLPCIAEMQYATMTQTSSTAQQVYNYAMTGNAANGGSIRPNKWLWFDTNAGTCKISDASAAILAGNMPVNMTRPSVYS